MMKKDSGRKLFLIAYFSYASIYIARLNFTVASPVLQENQLMSAAGIGMMGGIFFLFYSAGQLLNGYLGDIFPPKFMILTGLLLTAVSNLITGLLPGPQIMILLWGVNGFAQSMLWGPLLRTIAGHFSAGRKSVIASFLVSSVGTGSILGIFVATAAIHFQDIRHAFFWPGAISLLAFVIVFLLFHPQLKGVAHDENAVRNPVRTKTSLPLTPELVLLLIPAMCHGVLKDNINLWVAAYFVETFSVDLVTTSFYIFAVPLLGLIGRLIYPALYRLLRKREHAVSILAMTVAGVGLLPLCMPQISMVLAALCLSIAAAAISVVNTSFLTIYPMRYESCGCVSRVVGLMDFATYLGAGISSAFYGVWLTSHSYTGMFFSWILLSLLAVIILIIIHKKESKL